MDRLMRGPGLIRGAVMYTALLDRSGLHLVKTGPGWVDLAKTGLQRAAVKPIVARAKAKVAEGEAKLTEALKAQSPSDLAEISFSLEALSEVRVVPLEPYNVSKVTLKARSAQPSKLNLDAPDYNRAGEVVAFLNAVARGADVPLEPRRIHNP